MGCQRICSEILVTINPNLTILYGLDVFSPNIMWSDCHSTVLILNTNSVYLLPFFCWLLWPILSIPQPLNIWLSFCSKHHIYSDICTWTVCTDQWTNLHVEAHDYFCYYHTLAVLNWMIVQSLSAVLAYRSNWPSPQYWLTCNGRYLLLSSIRLTKFNNSIHWVLLYTPVPLRFWLILHSSEARFISSGHPRKTIVSQSDTSDLCLLTIRSVSDVFGVVWWGENGENVRWRN